jgi:hypothetical protein
VAMTASGEFTKLLLLSPCSQRLMPLLRSVSDTARHAVNDAVEHSRNNIIAAACAIRSRAELPG